MPKKSAKKAPAAKGKVKVKVKSEKQKTDKTFGLKNKKGKKAASIIRSAKGGENNSKLYQIELEKRREADRARAREEARLVQIETDKRLAKAKAEQEEIDKQLRSKTLCELFEKGMCKNGANCEYLHDWSLVEKIEKIDLYTDPRAATGFIPYIIKENEPVKKARICEFFLEAVKSKTYGFFWVCPNRAEKCQYKHYLPQGYLLPDEDDSKLTSLDETLSIGEEIDFMRNELFEKAANITEVTKEVFFKWVEKRLQAENDKLDPEKTAKKAKAPNVIGMTGKEYFLSSQFESESEEEEEVKEDKVEKEFVGNKSLFLDGGDLDDIDLDKLNL